MAKEKTEWTTPSYDIPLTAGVYGVFLTSYDCENRRVMTNERLVYIGSSKRMRSRIHQASHPYTVCMSRVSPFIIVTAKYIETEDYRNLEIELIKRYKPRFNKTHKNG